MEKTTVAEAAISLRIATRKACMCGTEKGKKSTLSLETKLLFLLKEKPLTPNNVADLLELKKSNLAALAKNLEESGLIERHKLSGRREVSYSITEKGLEVLNEKLSEIEATFRKFLIGEKDYDEAVETLESATRLLGFI